MTLKNTFWMEYHFKAVRIFFIESFGEKDLILILSIEILAIIQLLGCEFISVLLFNKYMTDNHIIYFLHLSGFSEFSVI